MQIILSSSHATNYQLPCNQNKILTDTLNEFVQFKKVLEKIQILICLIF